MAMLLYSPDDDLNAWRAALLDRRPGLDLRLWPDLGEPEAITTALVWVPPPGLLASLPNLRAVFSLAAGVDAMLRDPTLPELPLCRMVDPWLTQRMSEFVLLQSLRYHRYLDIYAEQQRRREWRLLLPPPPAETRIGIMGLGELGLDAAGVLARHGFTVKGWSRSPKSLPGVACHAGADGLPAFLDGLDILVCLLPLTEETENILDAGLFNRLKRGAKLVNLARGRHLVEADLIAALDDGQLAHATLDVQRTEPLPGEHPFWAHPKIDLTPHTASYTLPETGAATVLDNLDRLERGEPLRHVVSRERGY